MHRSACPSPDHLGAGLSAFLSCRMRSGVHYCHMAEPKQTNRSVQDEWLVGLTSPCPCLSDGEHCSAFYCWICQFIWTQVSESDLGKSISQVFHNAQYEILQKQLKAKKGSSSKMQWPGLIPYYGSTTMNGIGFPLPIHQYRQGSAECGSGPTEQLYAGGYWITPGGAYFSDN